MGTNRTRQGRGADDFGSLRVVRLPGSFPESCGRSDRDRMGRSLLVLREVPRIRHPGPDGLELRGNCCAVENRESGEDRPQLQRNEARSVTPHPRESDINAVIENNLGAVWTGAKSPKEIVQAVAAEASQFLVK